MKKVISFILIGSLALSNFTSVFAAQEIDESMFYNGSDTKTYENLSMEEASIYRKYDFDFPVNVSRHDIDNEDIAAENIAIGDIEDIVTEDIATKDIASKNKEVTRETIKKFCEEKEQVNIGDNTIKLYSSNILPQYLFDCSEIVEISEIGSMLYITYITNDNKIVGLTYSDEGLYSRGINDKESNVNVYMTESDAIIDRGESTYEMSDELKELIDEHIENDNIEGLMDIKGLNVTEVENGYIIEEILPFDTSSSNAGTSIMRASVPQTNTELSDNLKGDFPMMNKETVLSTRKYCSYLKSNIRVKIADDRNTYVRQVADWNSFQAGATVSIIAYALGGIPATAVVTILTIIGVAISAADAIMSNAKICSSAEYSFKGNRYGYAYDTTKWNDYVLVQVKKSTGYFAGGYDKNGDFTWIVSTQPSAFKSSPSTWANNVITYYNSDLTSGNGKTVFMPD